MGRALPILSSRIVRPLALPTRPAELDPASPLVDRQGRRYSYLRLSLSDRCNMACVYCMPPGGEAEHALREDLTSFEELTRLVRVLARAGIRRVRLTGGEPLVRRDVLRLVEMIAAVEGIEELAMTTNAERLEALASPLFDAGLTSVNVSLDSLEPSTFRTITRGGELDRVVAGIDAARAAGIQVKLNVVALAGLNDHEIVPLVEWAWARSIVPRFIELMPLGEGAEIIRERGLSAAAIRARLAPIADGALEGSDALHRGPARYLRARDGSGRKVGIITAVTDEFCASCNRLRLTAQGDLRACLADRAGISLRDLMRAGADDLDLLWALHVALNTKLAGHSFNDASVVEHRHVGMSLIGG